MDFSMTGQEKDDHLIEATAWTGLTVFVCKDWFSLSTIFLLDVGIVSIVWYIFVFLDFEIVSTVWYIYVFLDFGIVTTVWYIFVFLDFGIV
jgi:hypothetical protein